MARLITGGLGFVGAELAHMLVDRGEEVVIFDKVANRSRIDDIDDKVTVVQGDLANWSEVLNVVKGNNISAIFHFGSMLSAISEGNPWGAFQVNVVGTYNVLEAARLLNVEKVIFSSSVGTYGLGAGAEITDTTIQRPTGVYGVSKLYCEGLGRFYRTKFDLDFRSVRYPVVIGPGVTTPGHWCESRIENCLLGNH